MMKPSALVPIALVRRAHGVRGEVRIEPYNEESEILVDLEEITLRRRDGTLCLARITSCRRAHEAFLVQIEGVGDRDAAEALRGAQVLVPRAKLPAPEPGEFYHFDLVGLAVHDADGSKVGEVARVLHTEGQDLLVVLGPSGERLVPLVDLCVRKIDLESRRIDLEPWDEER
jgi:16S rRNA processing protein RimM